MIKPKGGYSEYFRVLWRMIKKFFYDIPHFGIRIAHCNFWGEFANSNLLPFGLNKKIKLKRHKLIFDFLDKKYGEFINNYKNKKIEGGKNTKKIWVLRRQGKGNAPDLVKICINSIEKHNCGHEVILLTQDNYKDYVKLPEFILKKVKEKKITITHLSDIIRMALLKEYGGIWIDATMFICGDVFKEFDNINLNTNYPTNFAQEHGGFEKWCGFFIGGKSNRLFSFVYDFFMQYHKDYSDLINYFLIDYAIGLAYNHFEDCKEDIDNATLRNNEIFTLQQVFNEKYEKEKYDNLMKNGFFKLSYKIEFNEYGKDGDLTNYGYFIKRN